MIDHFLAFEKLFFTLTNNRKKLIGSDQTLRGLASSVKSICNKSFTQKLPNNIFSEKKHITVLKNLKDKDIIITKPDDGKGVFILNKEYIGKTEESLQDTTKFIALYGN